VITPDPLQGNAVLVDALGSALRRGGNALDSVPDLLKRILREESWREFVTQRGEHISHDRLADFVTEPPLRGIGTSKDLVERLIEDDVEALAMWRAALKEKPGPKRSRNNITRSTSGTSKAYALERLARDAPSLHAEVAAGRLSAHAAMVQAGFRPPTFTVRADSAESVAATLKRRLTPEMLAELASKLT
jgi:hypothetical protein